MLASSILIEARILSSPVWSLEKKTKKLISAIEKIESQQSSTHYLSNIKIIIKAVISPKTTLLITSPSVPNVFNGCYKDQLVR